MTEQEKIERQREYVRKYHGKKAEIKVRVDPHIKTEWAEAAASIGKSLHRFIIDAVENAIREKEPDA